MTLKQYNQKRDFDRTPEPTGEDVESTQTQRFVVQRHHARRLHYDLRLEINGTLKSWAVPKGPSMNPDDKRLAIATEDHPLKYLDFHGTIPKGNYGAGEMIIWDRGIFEVDRTELDMSAHEQYLKGNMKLILDGDRLKGHFALVRTGERNGKESWLLIKKKDPFSLSVPYDAEALLPSPTTDIPLVAREVVPHTLVAPMLATPFKEVFNDPNWLYELKWDGYRVIAHISDKGVLLQSRNGIKLNDKFTLLVSDLEQLEHSCILDGEVVILNKDGISQFGELQNYPDSEGELRFYVFDLLYLNGHSTLDLSLEDRKSLLPELLQHLTLSRYCDHVIGMGTALYERAISLGMEGVIAKETGSDYHPGARTAKWLKIKSHDEVDALICGYTDSVDEGSTFGSLILGTHKDGVLTYIGNCGSGFGEERKNELLALFGPYRTKENPFKKKLSLKGRKPHWMVPELICEVNFSERTKNGLLRNPVFKTLKNVPIPIKKDVVKSQMPTKTTMTGESREVLEIDGRPVAITHLEKVYWPESDLNKFHLINYYLSIADTLLPHLKDRPQSLHRHPNGIEGEAFYQKDNENVPEWMETVRIYSESSERDIDYLLCQTTASLIHMANLGCIEINPWNSRVNDLERPDYGIVDLDPPEGKAFSEVIETALAFKKTLDAAKISGYCKTSGSKGLHIYIPMGAKYSYGEVRNFVKLLCVFVQQSLPHLTTMERAIKKRDGKIYLDYLQNRKGQTIASVYSVRPVPGAQVSMPLEWKELKKPVRPADFTLHNAAARIKEKGDLFAPLLSTSIDMEKAIGRLESFTP
ncbi:MAG: DNA ligase D [Sediminicola sp.]